MSTKEMFEGLLNTLNPIIENDEDIIDYIEGSNLNEEEKELFMFWLNCATTCVLLNGAKGEAEKEIFNFCQQTLGKIENKLNELGFDKNIGDTLRQVLQENIQEWVEIIREKVQEASQAEGKKSGKKLTKKEQGNVVGEEQDSPAFALFKYLTYFLGNVVMREDDALEFFEKYKDSCEEDSLPVFFTVNVLFGYLNRIKNGDIEIPAESQVAKYLDEMIEICRSSLESMSNECIHVEETDEFNKDMFEVIEDHFNEFIKKTYKYAIRAQKQKK